MHAENIPSLEHKSVATKRVVLVGQPNVGKSVLFNALTGSYVMVSNYPGTTVDVTRGVGQVGAEFLEFVDSPGINSLVASSDEEKVTRSLLLGFPDVVAQVADMKNLGRALTLTLELAHLRVPMVLVLNMKDEALSRGYHIDLRGLSSALGIPVVETVATTQEGLEELKLAFFKASKPSWLSQYSSELARAIEEVQHQLPTEISHLAPMLLSNHTTPDELAPSLKQFLWANSLKEIGIIRERFLRPVDLLLMEARQLEAAQLAAQVLAQPSQATSPWISKFMALLGRWCIRPWPGYLIAGLVLFGLYEFVGVFAAQTCVNFLEKVLFGKYLNPAIIFLVRTLIPLPYLQNMLIGNYGVFTMALTYAFALILPIVSAFFLALGILEDTGYLPRLSVLTDKLFKLMGLNGKAVLPMILGLGCGTMAMLTTRILDTKKEKVLVSFLLALAVPCSAQLGVILGMASGLSLWVSAVWLGVVVGTLLGAGSLASKILPGASVPLLLEIPPMRLPLASNLARKVAARLKWYLKEVVPLFVYGTLALYFLDTLGWLKVIEHWSAPIVTGFLGLPEKATEAFLIGFLRRDYGAAGLYQLQRGGFLNLRQSAVAMVAITLFMPCIAQVMMTVKERGAKVATGISLFVLGYALIVSGALNKVLVMAGW